MMSGVQEFSVHMVMQMCDTKFYQVQQRICGPDRTALSKRSLTSLIDSIVVSSQRRSDTQYHLHIITDTITPDLDRFCGIKAAQQIPRLRITREDLQGRHGISTSIQACYIWMQDHGRDLVAQFQDDYLFYPDAIDDAIDMFYQARNKHSTDPVLSLFNNPRYWLDIYSDGPTPRLISLGRNGYWIQFYDVSCSFMTSHWQFNRHWDLYTDFFYLIDKLQQYPEINLLENRSLNLMFVQRGVLGLLPVQSLALHIQSEHDRDPYRDWRTLWENTHVD